ncbi:hypothetical protein LPTSP4_08700 [Leptospira ryugenii]|uniref:Uncharacterized protein n=1 Tax=Leptospira ryugenii TaxID=1917863 RepID=A0A2P2DXK8_9LEPT|nr:flagellar protein FlgN [Leptospira ryugenii]GBF49359.1 hypothetical protein LPTSP4_08700 [Leptospira ryugenii]
MRIPFYQKKKKYLLDLISNLQKEAEYLSYGDADSAVQLEFKNENLIQKLKELDQQNLDISLDLPASSEDIQASQEVFQLLDQAREIQSKVQKALETELQNAKKEYYEFQVQRKLKVHFAQNLGLSWIKNYC